MYPPSPSKSPPRPIEPIHSVQFTSHQLLALLGRLRLLAPNGTIITESFIDLICELSNKTVCSISYNYNITIILYSMEKMYFLVCGCGLVKSRLEEDNVMSLYNEQFGKLSFV